MLDHIPSKVSHVDAKRGVRSLTVWAKNFKKATILTFGLMLDQVPSERCRREAQREKFTRQN